MKLTSRLKLLIKATNFGWFIIISVLYGGFMGGAQYLFSDKMSLVNAIIASTVTGAAYNLIFCMVVLALYFNNVARVLRSVGMLNKEIFKSWITLILTLVLAYEAIIIALLGVFKTSSLGLVPVIMGINLNYAGFSTYLTVVGLSFIGLLAVFTFASAIGAFGSIFGGFMGASAMVLSVAGCLFGLPWFIHYFESPVMVPASVIGLSLLFVVSLGVILKLAPKIEVVR